MLVMELISNLLFIVSMLFILGSWYFFSRSAKEAKKGIEKDADKIKKYDKKGFLWIGICILLVLLSYFFAYFAKKI
ncbi:MAG TPA: hypothetical protein PK315_08525 [Petrotogaceae bacterium]|nr:hypothetical protein [Petrotogaceae bacterium]